MLHFSLRSYCILSSNMLMSFKQINGKYVDASYAQHTSRLSKIKLIVRLYYVFT